MVNAIPIQAKDLKTSFAVPKKEIPEENHLKELAYTKGWEILKELIDFYIDTLRDNVEAQDTDSLEMRGAKQLSSSITIKYLQSIINVVDGNRGTDN